MPAPLLDTSDARMTQAVQAVDPRLVAYSFWTQHTVFDAVLGHVASAVRWYEINPVPATPVVLRTGLLGLTAADYFVFNAARRDRERGIAAFGDSFVIEYNISSKVGTLPPSLGAVSSVHGGGCCLGSFFFLEGVGPYRDGSCPNPGDICRWGDYSAATPDPRPVTAGTVGVVWGTNQFSGVPSPPANGVNWRTRIFAVQP
jgi:hypothetical protein